MIRTIINRASFRFDAIDPEIGDQGSVEVTVNGETRRVPANIGGSDVIYTWLLARYGDDPKWYTVVLNSKEDGREYFEMGTPSAPDHLEYIVPDEIQSKFREFRELSFDCVGLLAPRTTPRGPDEPAIHVISGENAEALIRGGLENLFRDGVGVLPPNSITVIDTPMEFDLPGCAPFAIAVTFESGLRDDIGDYLNSTEVL